MRTTFDRASGGDDLKAHSERDPWSAALAVGLLLLVDAIAVSTPEWAIRLQGSSASPNWMTAYQLASVCYFLAWMLIIWVVFRLWREGVGQPGSLWLALSYAVLVGSVAAVVILVVVGDLVPGYTQPQPRVASALLLIALRVLPPLATVMLAVGLLLSRRIARWIPALCLAGVACDVLPVAATVRSEWQMIAAPITIEQATRQPGIAVLVLGYIGAALTIAFWISLAIALRSRGAPRADSGPPGESAGEMAPSS